MSRIEQRAIRGAQHFAAKERKAKTPLAKTGTAFDEWRYLVSKLPTEFADQLADQMTNHIRAEVTRLKPARGGDRR